MVRVNLIDFYIPAPTAAAQRQVKHYNTTEFQNLKRQSKHLLIVPQLLALVALIAVLIGLFINRR